MLALLRLQLVLQWPGLGSHPSFTAPRALLQRPLRGATPDGPATCTEPGARWVGGARVWLHPCHHLSVGIAAGVSPCIKGTRVKRAAKGNR